LSAPEGVAVDASGNIYIADTGNQRIRYVNASGTISTIGGTATRQGSAATARRPPAPSSAAPAAVALDASGAVYVADQDNNRIRRFTVGGAVNTIRRNDHLHRRRRTIHPGAFDRPLEYRDGLLGQPVHRRPRR
jgi:trimeric autotransporter adhesin